MGDQHARELHKWNNGQHIKINKILKIHEPLITEVDPFILPPELEEWYCTKKEDERLMPNEYWRNDCPERDGGEWQICQRIQGVYIPTPTKKNHTIPSSQLKMIQTMRTMPIQMITLRITLLLMEDLPNIN